MGLKAPNFLMIMADQLAADGNPTVKGPNIDRIAEHGVVFENCFCNLPMRGPFRASMHCGVLPFSIGMCDNACEFSSEIPTIAHDLRSLGYRAELSGKMHFRPQPASREPKASHDRHLSVKFCLDRRLVKGQGTPANESHDFGSGRKWSLHQIDADGLP